METKKFEYVVITEMACTYISFSERVLCSIQKKTIHAYIYEPNL